MHAGEEQHVELEQKIPVHIVYFTVGRRHRIGASGPDVYGYDAIQTSR